jgi:hypothetical protein
MTDILTLAKETYQENELSASDKSSKRKRDRVDKTNPK